MRPDIQLAASRVRFQQGPVEGPPSEWQEGDFSKGRRARRHAVFQGLLLLPGDVATDGLGSSGQPIDGLARIERISVKSLGRPPFEELKRCERHRLDAGCKRWIRIGSKKR